MKALLKTRCGCTREMDVDGFRADIFIALRPGPTTWRKPGEPVPMAVTVQRRRFALRGVYAGVAEFEEVPE